MNRVSEKVMFTMASFDLLVREERCDRKRNSKNSFCWFIHKLKQVRQGRNDGDMTQGK